jgi:hypothetical protein
MSSEDKKITMSYTEWIQYGMENSYCGPPVCATHDGEPWTTEEEEAFEQGDDLCVEILRLYHDIGERLMVESAHSPSLWRRSGWE